MSHAPKQPIENRFDANIARVRGLVSIYDSLITAASSPPPDQFADILRAAVVLLHAALEDFLRSLEGLRLPEAAPDEFARMPLAPQGHVNRRQEKFSLVELAAYRGQTVDEVFRKAIDLYLEKSNWNDVGDVKSTLKRIGVGYLMDDADEAKIQAMIKRRHWIAHRADPSPETGRAHPTPQAIAGKLVEQWIDIVEKIGKDVLALL